MKTPNMNIKALLGRLRRVQVGETLHLYSEDREAEISRAVEAGLRRGDVVLWPDGRRQFVEVAAVVDTAKVGSAMYLWDATGNRVKCTRVLVTMRGGNVVERQALRPVYRDFGEV